MERTPSGSGSGIVGADSGRVLVRDLAEPRTGPGRARPREHRVSALAVLPGGRVVTGGYDDRGATEASEQLARHFARMLRVRARYRWFVRSGKGAGHGLVSLPPRESICAGGSRKVHISAPVSTNHR